MGVRGERPGGAGAVSGAHRVIRVLGDEEGPYAGALVTYGESVAVSIDTASLTGWAGWSHSGDEHVAAPVDVVRRADGHDVLLPWCVERVEAFLARRDAADVPLVAGETSTLVASMLRGLAELGRAEHAGESGGWWLTDDGRPMFVVGEGGRGAEEAARIVERLVDAAGDRGSSRLLSSVAEGLRRDPQRPTVPLLQLEDWERALCELASPRPLRRDVHPPERAHEIEIVRRMRHTRASGKVVPSRGSVTVEIRRRLEGFASVVRHGLASIPARRGKDTRRPRVPDGTQAPTGGRAGRGRMLVVASVAAAVVIGAGLLWPGGESGASSGGAGQASQIKDGGESEGGGGVAPSPEGTGPTVEPRDASTETRAPSVPPTATTVPDDPMLAAPDLLLGIEECAQQQDPVCGAIVAEGSTGIIERLGADVGTLQNPRLELVDEYGDVAVIRLSPQPGAEGEAPSPAGEHMLVLVRLAEKWLVRDAYDIADQPG